MNNKKVYPSAEVVLAEPLSVRARMLMGDEILERTIPRYYTYTNKMGDTFYFDLHVYRGMRGYKRAILFDSKHKTLASAIQYLINAKTGHAIVVTMATAEFARKIGLITALLTYLANTHRNIQVQEPISELGRIAVESFKKKRGL